MSSVDRRVPLCAVNDVAAGRTLRVERDGFSPILVCNVEGSFYAVDDECTHAGAALSDGRLRGRIVICPMHGGSFDVHTGEPRSSPCKQSLRTWPLQIADGQIYLLLKG